MIKAKWLKVYLKRLVAHQKVAMAITAVVMMIMFMRRGNKNFASKLI